MKDNPEFNVQFVSIIEKYPLSYDYNSNQYSNRNLQDKAWEKISKELNESVFTDCSKELHNVSFFSVHDYKERWKNLKGSYTRHLKYINTPLGSAAKKKKPYYLAEHMTFLTPFTKSEYEEGLENEAFSPISPRLSSYTPDSAAPASEVTRTSKSSKVFKKSRLSFNKSGPTLDDVKKSAFQYFESKKALNQITSDIKKMNDNQKRRYKIEMLTSAGNILNEKVESTSSPDNVYNTGGTSRFITSPPDNPQNTSGGTSECISPPDNVQNTEGTNGFKLPLDNDRTAGGLVDMDRYFESKKALNQITSGKQQKVENPDVLFLFSLLADIKKMNDNQKRRYKIEMLTSAGNILNEKVESTSSPDNVYNTEGTSRFIT
ncbi:uncharacterized protein LOC115875744 [Sitophilus oryzae]|uniref:Uncharacterized protein LOC115875744 n=1 Tax=Sitophilus oryzae TaxID=7048 RepID=A0A6J2X8D0_SITOR|nr:uncharacterized protein LOC115875744 [Sitophilus oryzae]